MAVRHIVNSERAYTIACDKLRQDFEQHKYVVMSTRKMKRSDVQNSLLHVWTGEIAQHEGYTALEAKLNVKLDFGLPILLEDTEHASRFTKMGFDLLLREEQMEWMKIIPVTSLLDVQGMKRCLNDMQCHYAQNGLILRSVEE